MGAKYSACDIADAFVSIFKYDEDGITNLKVQKLLYYAQGISFQRFGCELFPEQIEAWRRGPVVNAVYAKYADLKNAPILNNKEVHLDTETERLIIDVAREYGKYTTAALIDMTHIDGSPWEQVYKEEEQHTIIPKATIKDYFINVEPKLEEPDWDNAFINTLPCKEAQ